MTARYAPRPPPTGLTLLTLSTWIYEELKKLSYALEAHEAATVTYGKEARNVASGATLTVDWKARQKQRVEVGADCTLAFARPHGACNIVLRVVQDAVGGWELTLPPEVKWPGGITPALTEDPNGEDVICMYYDGTYYHATISVDSR